MFNRKEFNQKIQQEFEDYREFILELSGEEVFELAFEINFKTILTEYLISDNVVSDEIAEKLNKIDYDVLDFLFDVYMSSDIHYEFDFVDEVLEEFEKVSNEDIYNS